MRETECCSFTRPKGHNGDMAVIPVVTSGMLLCVAFGAVGLYVRSEAT